ncbi:zinc-binding dehydrogenase [Microbacterium sp. I2]|uniref:zinc-binding dehydrogenase n=1 Tax=Microbacterium sp. I2 TaxID=3391826 RepID=UPI003ED9A054
MRAVTIRSFGDPDGLELLDLASPEPSPGEVSVRVEAIGVGGVDAVIRRGSIGGSFSEGIVLGSEVAGIVTAVGDGVDSSWVGTRVWAFTGIGGYAEQAVARVDDIVALPDTLSSVDAVALGSAGPVAHFALAHAHLARGETVLVRGAAGSIGIAAVELARKAGAAAVAVTTSSAERGERLRGFGATHVLERDGTGDDSAPRDFDVILDVVAGPATPLFIERLAPNGRMVIVGIVGGYPPADFGTGLLARFQRSLTLSTFSLDTVSRAELHRVRSAQLEAATRGELHAVVHDVLDLAAAVDAHRSMDAGAVFGRIVLTP